MTSQPDNHTHDVTTLPIIESCWAKIINPLCAFVILTYLYHCYQILIQ